MTCFIAAFCAIAFVSSRSGASESKERVVATVAGGYNAPGVAASIVYAFRGAGDRDGRGPAGRLYLAPDGELFGATGGGGLPPRSGACYGKACGTVFVLKPAGSGYAESVLYRFSGGADGGWPQGHLVADASGALYDVASFPSVEVYQIRPLGSGYTETTLLSGGARGQYAFPFGPVALANDGNVLVTLWSCVPEPWGCVAELAPSGSGYTPKLAARLPGNTGVPGGLTRAKNGTLLTTKNDDDNIGATVYKMTPSPSGYSEHAIYQFPSGSFDADVSGDLVVGPSGTIYGVSGDAIFALVPHGERYELRSLARFTRSTPLEYPYGDLVLDARGNIYGAALLGGLQETQCFRHSCGAVFELQRTGGAFKLVILHEFAGAAAGDGANPSGGLVSDGHGSLYGETSRGGAGCGDIGCGTVYKISLPGSR